MKKAIVCLLLFAFILSSLTACKTTPPKESETIKQTQNIPSSNIENEEKYKPVLDIYKDVIINLDDILIFKYCIDKNASSIRIEYPRLLIKDHQNKYNNYEKV